MTKKIIKWLGVLSLIVGLIVGIKSLWLSEDKAVETEITTKGKDSPIINGNNNTFQKNSYVINNTVSSKKKSNENEYSIIGTSNKSLFKNIEKFGKIKLIPNSNYIIEITHTGEVSLLDKDSDAYIYSGGNVLVKVDNQNCFEFENLKIFEMKPNSKNSIINEIQKNIDNYINNNPKLFSNKIIECIRKQ
jgi:lipopolysaccharide export LptBFGC system permease protein LptF